MTPVLIGELLSGLMFFGIIGFLLLGFPVAFTLAGVSLMFGLVGMWLGVFDPSNLGSLANRYIGYMTNEVLVAVPLFIFMGVMLERSKIAEQLLLTMGKLFGNLRGGLGMSVIVVGALLAASTGVVGATVVTMGLISLPAMLRAKYDPRLASGVICASGTLGQIIPPSTLLIILADVMSSAFQQAQYKQGKFSIETISVGQTFAAALLPGLLLVALYVGYVLLRAWLVPADAPAMKDLDRKATRGEVMGAILPAVILIVAVLGAVLFGVASPNEAASVGAIGAILLAGYKQGGPKRLILGGAIALFVLVLAAGYYPVRLQRSDAGALEYTVAGAYALLALTGLAAVAVSLRQSFGARTLIPALTQTMVVTSMIFATILMASFFSLVFVGLGGEHRVANILAAMPGGPTGALIFAMAFIFVLGFFLDFVEIAVILLPLLIPPLILMGYDPVWLAVLIAINLQSSFLTPPFGFSLFYLRGAAPKEVTTGLIYQGVVPFILLQILAMALIWFVPQIGTFLPKVMF